MKNHFNKYHYYTIAVQSPAADVDTFFKIYKENKGKLPSTLKEDFCGTFLICKEWVKRNPKNRAFGLDLDPAPLKYGLKLADRVLTSEQRERLSIINGDVLRVKTLPVDLTVAVNFSYYIFKTRKQLHAYFTSAYKSLDKNGILLIDSFGGSECQHPNKEVTRFKRQKFDYIWEQKSFDPVTNGAKFEIHFKVKGHGLKKRCFTYDWRMWTIPEIREIMLEAGFKKTLVYWEGTTRAGGGDGKYKVSEKGEDCAAWIAYICGIK